MAVVDNLEALLAKGTDNALLCWTGCPNAAERIPRTILSIGAQGAPYLSALIRVSLAPDPDNIRFGDSPESVADTIYPCQSTFD